MKSTNNNLLNLVHRLIVSGIILFICTEVLLAYVAAFYLIPSNKELNLSKDNESMRIGIENGEHARLLTGLKHSVRCSYTNLRNAKETYIGFKYNVFDAVKTDQLTARILMEKEKAVPFAFLYNEDAKAPEKERLVLITKNKDVDFFEQTKGLRLVISSDKMGIQNIVVTEFLNERTGAVDKWFSECDLDINDEAALEKVRRGLSDIAAVSEENYKKYLKKQGKTAENLRVLWYSNPMSRSVIMVRKDLGSDQIKQLKTILKSEVRDELNWVLFEESLESIVKWPFTIRGKEFDYTKNLFSAGINL
ncbi:MAG: phosphate/phosphite/phosphonate ABC transporter substrate-binding protein [Lentisphaeraceae bacterium]|nr:phosphate/phosphite/phosphonate ABC transporter substrate-binding protein [Lentisphaeraceae bacterium]